MKEIKLPEISLVLLVGPSSTGKSTFARKYFLPTEVISSDYCRALVSDDENDLSATDAAFEVLHLLAEKRLKMGKLTVIDALNIRREDRARLIQLAKENYALAAAIVLETPIRNLFDRHSARTDRNFGKNVLERQYNDFRHAIKTIEREGFSYVHFVHSEETVNIVRQKLWNNKKEERGAFDIIGDIHGCFDELTELLAKLGYALVRNADGHFVVQHPENRRLVFLGDLTDRGNNSPDVLRLVMDMVKSQKAFCVCGNHDEKLNKYLQGKKVVTGYGLEETIRQLERTSGEFRQEVKVFLDGLIAHYVLDDGKLVVAHAGIPEAMQGRAAAAVRSFCLFGETTGEIDEFGLPVRYNWARQYRGKAMVVYGHTPVPKIEWLNNTVNLDTGCVFGGKLSALRYPEKEIVSVDAKQTYYEPVRPVQPEETPVSASQELDDLLEIDSIHGKKIIETRYNSRVIIREENAMAALEVMSRFAVAPQWLIYLPPTMSPPETSALPNFLEHPQEVFDYYIRNGITRVICEEKHMGSRAVSIVCKSPETAQKRFGLRHPAPGTVYTRTGRKFFNHEQTERELLEVLWQALTASGFWDQFNTDWVCLDGELMPWNARARDLLIRQYAAVGSAARIGLDGAVRSLEKARDRGIMTQDLIEKYATRKAQIEKYIVSYRHYCRETDGLKGLVYAPFHILAMEGQTCFDKNHAWHLENIQSFCQYEGQHLMVTDHMLVDLQNPDRVQQAIDWWMTRTSRGSEGMVVKPLDYVPNYKGKPVQPAMKVRGSEYLRIIYGPEYDAPENIRILKERNLRVKRELALREFTLGLEALERFVGKEPLRRTHECVFGILALESEAVDPRL